MKSGFKPHHISAVALLFAQAAIAQAQDVQPQATTDKEAQEPAAVSADDIVVTGMRASLSSAQNIKRNARQLVDSVVAEDIGKLPDNNVVEALQRVPGIQVSPRARGESATVLIRGLPDVVTLINGRNIFSTTGRSLSLADVPADLVSGVDVYKSRSADQLEGGIAGLINVRTRRPFDFKGFEVALAGRQVYSEQPDKIDPYVSALVSNRWSTGIGEIGALVSVSYHKTRYRDETIFSGGYFGYNPDNSRAPYTPGVPLDPRGSSPIDPRVFRTDVIGAFDRIGTRTRPAVNATLQWAPDDRLTIHADGLFYGYRERGNGNQNFTSMNGTLLSPLQFVGDTKLVESLSIANGRVANFGNAYKNKADRWQGALGADWEAGDWKAATEFSYTRSKATDIGNNLDVDFIASRTDAVFNDGSGTPHFTLPNDDPADPSRYYLSRLSTTRTIGDGTELAWRGDLSYRSPFLIFSGLDAGVRLSKRDAKSDSFTQTVNCSPTGAVKCYDIKATSLPGLMTVTPGDFYAGTRPYMRRWATPATDYLLNDIGTLRQLFGLAPDDPAFQDTQHFDITEKNYAGYGQANIEAGRLDGQIGVRVIRTDITSSAFLVLRGATSPVTIRNKSTDVLPSLALRYKLKDNLFLRLAASKTITRPSFAQLNPALTLTPPIPGQQPFGRGTSGNADLKPIRSDNYDLSLEWYIDRSSSITATIFRRDVTGFIQSVTSNFDIDYLGADNGVYQITRPENSGSGRLQGIEGGFTFFPKGLPTWLDGVGVSANGTYIDGKNTALSPLPGVTGYMDIPFQNVSKYSATGTLIYEKGGFSGRASYVWRDKYNGGLHFTGVNPNFITNGQISNLDLSFSYEINPKFTVVFDATNVLKNLYQTSFNDPRLFPRDTVLYTRTFAFGFRAKL
ncbi:TonB-dependent receptor [Sphingomonas cannabina]|uniref:TonB-dependent receptor n=1 Tax=Sphingomonas cannabina TaxID=2899123 RepID=UPI001F444E10|nr:TonB-dependent receptor [Sphingomonas cannabina]UIJ44208.1 TonB-dependent receptor [Sphingomonas cannabina]